MNKANWQTGAAGLAGVIGLGLGWWWADAVAAALISIGIILDGWRALRVATAELVDGVPRELGSNSPDPEAEKLLVDKLEAPISRAPISGFARPAATSMPRLRSRCPSRAESQLALAGRARSGAGALLS